MLCSGIPSDIGFPAAGRSQPEEDRTTGDQQRHLMIGPFASNQCFTFSNNTWNCEALISSFVHGTLPLFVHWGDDIANMGFKI